MKKTLFYVICILFLLVACKRNISPQATSVIVETIMEENSSSESWDEVEYSDSYTYCVKKGDVAIALWEDFLTDEDVESVQGGFDALEDDKAWTEFLNIHFDELFEKYYEQLLEYFKDDATEAFENEFTWDEYQASKSNWNESCSSKSMIEELEDADTYSKRLTMCPECCETSYDAETGFCISCGFN